MELRWLSGTALGAALGLLVFGCRVASPDDAGDARADAATADVAADRAPPRDTPADTPAPMDARAPADAPVPSDAPTPADVPSDADARIVDAGPACTVSGVRTIAIGDSYDGTLTGGTNHVAATATCDGDPPVGTPGPDDVFLLHVPTATRVVVSTANPRTDFDSVVSIRTRCGAVATQVACSDNVAAANLPSASYIDTTLAAGDYYVIVDGYAGATGDYTLVVRAAPDYAETTIPGACDPMGSAALFPLSTMPGWAPRPSAVTALPFAVQYWGMTATHFSVTPNGFAQLWSSPDGTPGDSHVTDHINAPIPTGGGPDALLAPYWDQLTATGPASNPPDVRTAVFGTAPGRHFTIQWTDWTTSWSALPVAPPGLTFQVKLFETTDVIEFHYCALTTEGVVESGRSATIGIEGPRGRRGVQHSYNTAGSVSIVNGLRYTPM